ncbi:MAG: hypothetical protein H0X02_01900 [Nitrosomonas sp.]|nr:hypothetical protein [Nitrosomonas sp.]
MTARELLKGIKSNIETTAAIDDSETRVTPIYSDENKSVARIMADVEGGTIVLQVTVEKLCVYPGLKGLDMEAN